MSATATSTPAPAATRDAPAFDFYPERWLVGVATLSDAEQLSYLRLLCHQWTLGDAGLPAEAAALKRLAGKGVTPALLAKFPQHADGRRRNRRLEIVRAAQRKRIQEASERGRRMAEGRWKDKRDMPPPPATPARDGTPAGTGTATPAAAASASMSVSARDKAAAGTVAAGPHAACAEQAGFTVDVRGRPGPAGGDARSEAGLRDGAEARPGGSVAHVNESAAAGANAAAAAASFQRSVDESGPCPDACANAPGDADGAACLQRGVGAASASASAAVGDADACAMHKQCISNAHHSPPTTHLPEKESESNAQAGADGRQGSCGREGERADEDKGDDTRQGQHPGQNDGRHEDKRRDRRPGQKDCGREDKRHGQNDGESGAATLAEVKAYAPTVMAPDGCAEAFWNDCQASGWVNRHGQPIVQWQPLFRNYATQWKARLSRPPIPPRRAETVRNDTANKPGRYA